MDARASRSTEEVSRRFGRLGVSERNARTLIDAGLESAHHITAFPEAHFVETHGPSLDPDGHASGADAARAIYRRALGVKTQVRHLVANIRDTVASHAFQATAVANVDPGLIAEVQSIPSYRDLFGGLDFCACEYCQSVLGPAAYFVDVMRITDQYITARNPDIPEKYKLEDRRPDLFTMPLDCANTNTVVPYLSIVNTVLEKRIKADLGSDVFKALATARYPFNEPFARPLTQIRLWLSRLGPSLTGVFDAFAQQGVDTGGVTTLNAARERLGLSLEQYAIVTTPAADSASIAAFYGYGTNLAKVPFAGPGTISFAAGSTEVTGQNVDFQTALAAGQQIVSNGQTRTIQDIPDKTKLVVSVAWTSPSVSPDYIVLPVNGLQTLTEFLTQTGLTRDSLVTLLNQSLDPQEIAAGVANTFFINATGEGLPPLAIATVDDPLQPFEVLVNVSLMRFDRINRFVRGAAAIGWSYADLDCGLRCSGEQEITAKAVISLGGIALLQAQTGLAVDVLCSFWHHMTITGRVDTANPQDLFDRIFNSPALLHGENPYAQRVDGKIIPFDPIASDHRLFWKIPDRTQSPPQADPARDQNVTIRSRLLGALFVDDQSLTTIAYYLLSLLGPPASASDVLELNLANMTWLYRLAKWPAMLRMTVDAFLEMLCLLYYPAYDHLKPPTGVLKPDAAWVASVKAVADWIAASPFSVYELQYILLDGALGQSRYVNPGYRESDIKPFLEGLATLATPMRVTPDVFVFEDVATTESPRVFEALVEGGFLTPLGIFLPKDITATTIAFAFHVRASSFITEGFIDAAASKVVYDALIPKDILIPVPETDYATVSATFTVDTPLDFLFVGDPDADIKRAQVRAVLLMLQRDAKQLAIDINHTVELLTGNDTSPGLRATQEQSAIQALSSFFKTTADLITVLPPLYSATGPQILPYLKDLLSPLDHGVVPAGIVQLMARLSRGLMLARKLQLEPHEIVAILLNPKAFNIADLAAPTLSDIQALTTFKSLATSFRDAAGLVTYLDMSWTAPPADREKALAHVAHWSEDALHASIEYFWPQATDSDYRTVSGVARLAGVFDLASRMGVDTYFLRALANLSTLPFAGANQDQAWQTYTTLAGSALDAVRARYGETAFPDVFEATNGQILTRTRDALLAYLLWMMRNTKELAAIKTPSDLYQYLLMDVEMTDCDATSNVAQAIGSVQLYMQRCRIRQEPGVDNLQSIPAVWWSWMSSFQVWAANRKIFLYPENYIDPTLRRGASDLFKQLQSDLLQSEVDESTVGAAFRTYFDGFAEVADLVYVDSYCLPRDGDPAGLHGTVFVFGRTNTAPYTYYSRTYAPDTGRWSQWSEIALTINSPTLTPLYAFGRLFLFWVEHETTVITQISNGNEAKFTAIVATIYYTFFNHSNTWTQPQKVQQKIVAKFEPDTYTDNIDGPYISPKLIDPHTLYWHKPFPMRVPPKPSPDPAKQLPERIMVALGALFRLPDEQVPVPPVPDDKNSPYANELRFNSSIYQATNRANQTVVVQNSYPGFILFDAVAMLGANLAEDNPYLITLDYNDLLDEPRPYRPALDGGSNQLRVRQSDNILVDNYITDYKPPSALAIADPQAVAGAEAGEEAGDDPPLTLLYNVNFPQAKLVTVKNQPGWFFFDNGDEAFLLRANDPTLQTVTGTLVQLDRSVSRLPGELGFMNGPYTTANPPFSSLKFSVTRLTTRTVDDLNHRLFTGGVQALLTLDAQKTPELPFERFFQGGSPPPTLIIPPLAEFDRLDFDGAYGLYFKEIFFHTPFLIAWQLAANRKYDQARLWLQYIFDPTHAPEPDDQHANDRYWRYLPFRTMTVDTLAQILQNQAQIDAYNDEPFDPDAIAELRPAAYAKAVVMKYIDVLIGWGDALFAVDTRESINQATNLYVMAADLLGPRPVPVGACHTPTPVSFEKIKHDYPGGIPQFYIDLETSRFITSSPPIAETIELRDVPFNDLPIYFCVPENADLLDYWLASKTGCSRSGTA